MSEQTATVKVSVKPEVRDKYQQAWAELMVQGERVKLHEVFERAIDAYLEKIRKQRKAAA